MTLKDFIPPILIKLIKLIKRDRETERHRKYDNYNHALQDCTSDAYQNVELCNMIADKTSLYITKLKKNHFL